MHKARESSVSHVNQFLLQCISQDKSSILFFLSKHKHDPWQHQGTIERNTTQYKTHLNTGNLIELALNLLNFGLGSLESLLCGLLGFFCLLFRSRLLQLPGETRVPNRE